MHKKKINEDLRNGHNNINNGSFFDAGTNYGDIIKIVLNPPK